MYRSLVKFVGEVKTGVGESVGGLQFQLLDSNYTALDHTTNLEYNYRYTPQNSRDTAVICLSLRLGDLIITILR